MDHTLKIKSTISKLVRSANLDKTKEFAVIRDDDQIIVQFTNKDNAQSYANSLNKRYKENGLDSFARVLNLNEYLN